jgi:hypothetical protein
MNLKALSRFLTIVFIITGVSFDSLAQSKLSLDNKDFKVTKIRACFFASTATDGSNLFLPSIEISLTPKRQIDYLEFNGTFVDRSDNSSLGRDMSNETHLEPGIKYKLTLKSNTGWYAIRNQRVSVKINVEIDKPGEFQNAKFILATITNFDLSECIH